MFEPRELLDDVAKRPVRTGADRSTAREQLAAALAAAQARLAAGDDVDTEILPALRSSLDARFGQAADEVARRNAFSAQLGELLRTATDAEALLAAAAEAIGRRLDVARVGFAEVDWAAGVLRLSGVWRGERSPPAQGASELPIAMFGDAFVEDLRAGRSIALTDIWTEPRVAGTTAAPSYAALGVRSMLDVPLTRDGRTAALMFVHETERRLWTDDEIALAQDVAERVWSAAERSRAEAAERQSRAVLQTLVEQTPAAVAMWDRDMRYLAWSRRFVDEYGLQDVGDLAGRRHYDLFPDLPEAWKDAHRRALGGESLSAEEDPFPRASGRTGRTDYVRWSLIPWYAADGAVGGLLLFSEVITDAVETRRRLQASEARSRGLFDNAAVGLGRVAPDGRLLELNDRFCQIAGWRRENLVGRSFADITHPDDLAEDEANVAALAAGAIPSFSMEKRYLREDGSTVWVELTVSAVRAPDGSVDHFVSVVLDISERKAAVEALKRSEERLRLLADNLPDSAVFQCALSADRRTSTFLHLSRGVETLNGVTVADGLADAEALWSQLPSEHRRLLTRAKLKSARDLSDLDLETPMRRPDGALRWMRIKARPRREADGRVVWDGVQTDITRRRRAEARLQEREALLSSVLAGTEGLVFAKDREGRYVLANAACAAALGRSIDEVVGRTDVELMDAASAARLRAVDLEVMNSGRPNNSQETIGEGDEAVVYQAAKTPWRDGEGRIIGLVGTALDVTDARRMAAALAESETRLRVALDAAKLGVWDHDIPNARLKLDAVAARHLGLDAVSTVDALVSALHPEDVERLLGQVVASNDPQLRGPVDVEYRVRDGAGGWRWLAVMGQVEYGEADGRPQALRAVGVSLDVTERKLAESAAAAAAERAELAQSGARCFFYEYQPHDDSVVRSEPCVLVTGYTPAELAASKGGWRVNILPEDLPEFDRVTAEAAAKVEGFALEYRVRRRDGEVIWVSDRARAFRDPAGRVRLVGMVMDVTERKHFEERQELLVREVDHRAKNALTVVQAVVRLTKADTMETFVRAVNGRIQALSRVHNLLASSRWTGGDLARLLAEESAPYGESRVAIRGPEILLSPEAAQLIALAFHELFTNAAKYGALSAPTGRVSIDWRLEADGRLELRWVERGGPPITDAPARSGFGATVVRRTVERQLKGELTQHWRPEGVCYEMRFPVRSGADTGEVEA